MPIEINECKFGFLQFDKIMNSPGVVMNLIAFNALLVKDECLKNRLQSRKSISINEREKN